MSDEPYLIVAALWTKGDQADKVSAALSHFKEPSGFNRGAAVSFKRDQADQLDFQITMRRLNLTEVNDRLDRTPSAAQTLEDTPTTRRAEESGSRG